MIVKTNILDKKLKLPKYLYFIPIGRDALQVRGIGKLLIVRGENLVDTWAQIMPKLDGTHTIGEIISGIKKPKRENVLDIVGRMREKGLLEDASVASPPTISPSEIDRYERQITFFSSLFQDKKYDFQHAIKKSHVTIFNLGELGLQVLFSLAVSGVGKLVGVDSKKVRKPDVGLFYLGEDIGKPRLEIAGKKFKSLNPYVQFDGLNKKIRSTADVLDLIDNSNLVILCQEGPSISECRWMNEACLEKNIPWFNVKMEGYTGIIGPIVIPYQTACYTCYELGIKANLEYWDEYMAFEEFLTRGGPEREVDYGRVSTFSSILGGYATTEVIKLITNFPLLASYGKLHKFNFLTQETSSHTILKMPRCPSCGVPKRLEQSKNVSRD